MPHDLIRLMHSLFLPAARECQEACWRPSADVYRTPTGWLVKFEMAGVPPEDLQLEVRGRFLTVRGRRRDWAVEQGLRYYRMEIAYSYFERSLELPCELDPARIATEYHYGMLLVRVGTEGEP